MCTGWRTTRIAKTSRFGIICEPKGKAVVNLASLGVVNVSRQNQRCQG